MKYLLLGAITEAGQRREGPDLELRTAEIGPGMKSTPPAS